MDRKIFRTELAGQINRAQKQGRPHVEVNAGELHRSVGGYPPKDGEKHALPLCCQVMRGELDRGNAEIVFEPAGGAGPSLTIRYALPRLPEG